jgi:hypothetical protein
MAPQTQSRRSGCGGGGGPARRASTSRAPRRGRRRITIRACRAGVGLDVGSARSRRKDTWDLHRRAVCRPRPTRPSRARHSLYLISRYVASVLHGLPTDRRLELAASGFFFLGCDSARAGLGAKMRDDAAKGGPNFLAFFRRSERHPRRDDSSAGDGVMTY